MPRVRLDSLLAERGLYASRSRAAAAVLAGHVHVGPGRARAAKPGQLVDADVELAVDAPPPYVSRGGVKLANALDALQLDVAGRRALDVGASTGGFTDCLLQRGAEHVVALDVAYGELDWRLRGDERVTVIERTNARELSPDVLPYAPDLDRRRRLVHLADQGAARGAGLRRRALRLPGHGQAAVRGRPRAGGQGRRRARPGAAARGDRRRSPRAPGPAAPRCSASPPRGCPGRPATARRSCGSARAAARRRPRTRWRRSRYEGGERAHPPARGGDRDGHARADRRRPARRRRAALPARRDARSTR